MSAEEFLHRLLAIRQRMFPDAGISEDLTHRLGERGSKPTGMIRQVIERIRFREDDEPTPKPVEAAKPTPVSNYTEVYVGRANRETINQEFAGGPFQDDPTTSNWRNSIEASKPRKPGEEVNPLNPVEVERALAVQNQQANVIAFPKVSLK
jgi:hypothetical protein